MEQYQFGNYNLASSLSFINAQRASRNLNDQVLSKVCGNHFLRDDKFPSSSNSRNPQQQEQRSWSQMPMWCQALESTRIVQPPQEGVNRIKNLEIPIYHKLRGYYNDIQLLCMGVFAKPFFEALKQKDDKPIKVLDAGIGCGQFFVFYVNEKMDVIGVDPKPIYEIISKNAKTLGIDEKKIDILEQKLEDLELEDESIDYAVAAFVFGAVDDVSKSLQQIHRVLKPGGELYIMDYTLHTTNRWTQFKQIIFDPLYAYQERYHISRDIIQKLRESPFAQVIIDDKLARIDLPGGNVKPIVFATAVK
eukprot:TRINITY_DN1215_c0_g1_i1.p2 TRINITY_DN1215_c0_g1~~TRINITY_DN1215_c0_g1_i1.p2  ORF type:complete len:305 (+),score=43.39 TRINITY_DN1215_c0_g1_i1:185-1099(+)